jgi:multiple sugar transport system permease protein
LRWFAAAIVLANGFFPALWILLTSFKTEVELTAKPITYLPHAPTLANYMAAFKDQPLPQYLMNSLIVAFGSMVVTLFISSLAAYAIARLQLPRRNLILTCIIAVSMFPLVTLMVPLTN